MLTPEKRQIIENYIDKKIKKQLKEALVQPKKEASYYTDTTEEGLNKIYDQIEAGGYFADPDEVEPYFAEIPYDDTKEGVFTLFKDGKESPNKLVVSIYHMPVPPDYEEKKGFYHDRRNTNHYGQYKTTFEITDIVN